MKQTTSAKGTQFSEPNISTPVEQPTTMKGAQALSNDGVITIVEDLPVPKFGDRELLIKVTASAINRADTLQARGAYPVPPGVTSVLGLEAAGEVVKVGQRCEKGFKIGDKVMALLAGGGNAEYVATDERQVMKVPDGMDLTTAAGIPETWLTAFQLLFIVAKIVPEDTVVVHAAGSGVGTALVQLLRMNNTKCIICTAGGEDKLAKVRELGAHHCINRKSVANWADEILKITQGKGATVILDCIGYSYVPQNMKSAAVDCRWVLYGLMGGISQDPAFQVNLGTMLFKRIQLLPTTLRSQPLEYKENLVNQLTEKALPHFASGEFEVIIDQKSFDLRDINEAHAYMLSDQNIGKIILHITDSKM